MDTTKTCQQVCHQELWLYIIYIDSQVANGTNFDPAWTLDVYQSPQFMNSCDGHSSNSSISSKSFGKINMSNIEAIPCAWWPNQSHDCGKIENTQLIFFCWKVPKSETVELFDVFLESISAWQEPGLFEIGYGYSSPEVANKLRYHDETTRQPQHQLIRN